MLYKLTWPTLLSARRRSFHHLTAHARSDACCTPGAAELDREDAKHRANCTLGLRLSAISPCRTALEQIGGVLTRSVRKFGADAAELPARAIPQQCSL